MPRLHPHPFWMLALLLAVFNEANAQSPCSDTQVNQDYDRYSIFLQQPVASPNSSTPSAHSLLTSAWSAVTSTSDEFNGTSLDATKWYDGLHWGRTQPSWSNYFVSYWNHQSDNPAYPSNIQDQSCFQFVTEGTTKFLRLATKPQPITARVTRWDGDNVIQGDGRPNLRSIPYRTGMIESKIPTANPWGFFEIRCRLPRSQDVIADFWLHMANNGPNSDPYYPNDNFYNELDGFETDDGRINRMNAHYKQDCLSDQYNFYRELFIKGGFDLHSDFFTYAIQWEPNKVVYYLNNRPIYVLHNQNPNWPSGLTTSWDKRMYLIMDMGVDSLVGRSYYSPAVYPANYDIDYVRTFRRSDYTVPYPNFNLNWQPKALTVAAPLQVNISAPLILSAAGSYSPNNGYFLSVQECTSAGVLVGTEAMGWLSQSEIQSANSFEGWNIKASWLSAHGLTLGAGKYYQVKFVASGSTWIEQKQFIRVNACTDDLAFRINGNSGSVVSGVAWPRITIPSVPLNPGPASSSNPLIIEAGNAVSCSGTINLTLQRCDASGATLLGSQVAANHTAASLSSFDLFSWAQAMGIPLQEGNYYKVRLRNTTSLAEVSRQLYIEDCTPAISFAINDIYTSELNIRPGLHRSEITITDFQPTCFLSNALFLVSMETSDAWWSGFGDEVTQWMSYDDVWHLDLRAFAAGHGLNVVDGNYYRVSVSGDNNGTIPWMGTTKLMKVPTCTNSPNFTINGETRTDLTPVVIGDQPGEGIRMSAWSGVNCDGRYYISLKKTNASNVMVPGYPEISEWLDYDYVYYMGSGKLDNDSLHPGGDLGYFNLPKYAQARRALVPWPGASDVAWPEGPAPTLLAPAYYFLSLCTDGGQGFQCKQMMLKLIGVPTRSLIMDASDDATVITSDAGNIFKLYVEDGPSLEQALRSVAGWDTRQGQVLDLQGRIVGIIGQGRIEWQATGRLSAGVYIVRTVEDPGSDRTSSE